MMPEQAICLNYSLAIQAWDTLMQLVLKYTPEGEKKNTFNVNIYALVEIEILLTIEVLSLFLPSNNVQPSKDFDLHLAKQHVHL